MIRRASVLLTLVLIVSSTCLPVGKALAQETKKISRRPNIPGSIMFDFGFNGTMGSPTLWKSRLIATRTINIYYQYPLRFGRSGFSLNPGIGFSLERFAWKTNIILENPAEANVNAQVERYQFGLARAAYPNPRKPTLVTNYLDIPIELRFDTKPEDISRSFNVAIGARGGWMFDSFQKIKFKEDGQTKKVKDKEDFGLNKLRYGVYTRIGVGSFNVFAFYNLTPLFRKDMGPSNDGGVTETNVITGSAKGTTMTTFTVGISINGF